MGNIFPSKALKHLSKEDASDESEKEMQRLIQKITQGDVRIVLVGKTGSGKSSSGNTILGRDGFRTATSSNSVTRCCKKHVADVEGKNIVIIDTPGLYDTSMSEEELRKEIEKCVYMSVPGPHVFLLVIRLDVKFTAEEKNTIKWIQKNFGEAASRYTIILFTHADTLKGKPLDMYIRENNDLKALVSQCGGRFHSFNNEDMINRSQVTELMEKIKKMLQKNGGQHYTHEMFKKAQEKIENEILYKNIKEYGQKTLAVTGTVATLGVIGAGTIGAVVVAAIVFAVGAVIRGTILKKRT